MVIWENLDDIFACSFSTGNFLGHFSDRLTGSKGQKVHVGLILTLIELGR